jgi:phenylalanyl-tRNA synthetase beta chain
VAAAATEPTGTVVLGAVGEVDPAVAVHFGLGRVGWLEVDLGQLATVDRRPAAARPISRFPSSDIDVALVVDDDVPVDRVADALAGAGGDVLESVVLFDVYRGDGVPAGRRSLAFRLRFSSLDRTLTDQDVGELRQRCIDAAQKAVGAILR